MILVVRICTMFKFITTVENSFISMTIDSLLKFKLIIVLPYKKISIKESLLPLKRGAMPERGFLTMFLLFPVLQPYEF